MVTTSGFSKIARHFQVTIPKYIRELLELHEGDIINFEIRDNKIILTPVVLKSKDQAYFWTEKWQEEIKQAEKDLRKGDYKKFKSVKEMRDHFSDDKV